MDHKFKTAYKRTIIERMKDALNIPRKKSEDELKTIEAYRSFEDVSRRLMESAKGR
jgi:hypothetical protein